jgi:hypothetical protein
MSDFADVKFDFEASSSNDSSTIPEGDYLTEISTCEKTTSAAGNDYLKLEVKVCGDKYKGWIARDNLNLWYTNSDSEKQEMVREIASRKFSSLVKAVGRKDNPPANAGELVGNKVICSFGIEKSKNPDYPDDKNIIKAFKPLEKMSPKQADDTPAWVTEGTSEAKAPAKPSL